MKYIIYVAAVATLAAARPELYKEKEDFQFSRSSSDEGSKSGYYGAQRGNMGGNYERAHNMDHLAQNQMSGLVQQVEGELGDRSRTRTGSVFTAANSRGIYGSGRYDFSNLEGRNFQEGVSYGDSQSQSSLRNSAYGGHSTGSRSHSNSYSHNAEHSDSQRSEHFKQELHNSNNNFQDQNELQQQGSEAFSGSSGLSHSYYPQHRLVNTRPVRIMVRPGSRVVIPVATQTYDADHSATSYDSTSHDQHAAKGDAEVIINNDRDSSGVNNNKHYESSYSYHKEWEKHSGSGAEPSGSSTQDKSQSYDDSNIHNNNQYQASGLNSGATQSSNTYNSNVKSRYQSNYNTQQDRSSSSSNSNAFTHSGQRSGIDLAAYNHNARDNMDSMHQLNTNAAPQSYQSSYSYHKSWERQGDPYVIVPVPNGAESGQTSQRLSSAYNNQEGYSSHRYGSHTKQAQQSYSSNNKMLDCDCDEEGHIRVARSAGSNVELNNNQNKHYQDLNLGQQTENQWDQIESLGQQSQSPWDNVENLGQQTQQFNKIEDLGQQAQNPWDNSENLGQQTQKFDKIENLGQQVQNPWEKAEDLGQQTQNQFDKIEDLGQQAQSSWDKAEDLGQQSQNRFDKIEDLGQQTQNTWDKVENLSQQTQINNIVDVGQQTQNTWDKVENLRPQTQNQLHNFEDLSQQTQNSWNKLHVSQQTQNQWHQYQQELQNNSNQHQVWNINETPSNTHFADNWNFRLPNSPKQNITWNQTNDISTQINTNVYEIPEEVSFQQTLEQKKLDNAPAQFDLTLNETRNQNTLFYNLWDKIDTLDRDSEMSLDSSATSNKNDSVHQILEHNDIYSTNNTRLPHDTRNAQDVGRGDIGPEDSGIEVLTTTSEPLDISSLHKVNNLNDMSVMQDSQNKQVNNFFDNHKVTFGQLDEPRKNSTLITSNTSQENTYQNVNFNFNQANKESKLLDSKKHEENFDQQNVQDFGDSNLDRRYIDHSFHSSGDHISDLGQENMEQSLQDFREPNLDQQNLQDFGELVLNQQNIEQNLQDFGQHNLNVDQRNLQDFGEHVLNINQQNIEQNLQDFGEHVLNVDRQNIQDFKNYNSNYDQQNIEHVHEFGGYVSNLDQQNMEHSLQYTGDKSTQQIMEQNLQDFGQLTQNLNQENIEEKSQYLTKHSIDVDPEIIYQGLHDLRQKQDRERYLESIEHHNQNLDKQNMEQNLENFKEEHLSQTSDIETPFKFQIVEQQGQKLKPLDDNIDHPVKSQAQEIIEVSSTTPIPITEKPGFWSSVANKYRSAKDKVKSWFGKGD